MINVAGASTVRGRAPRMIRRTVAFAVVGAVSLASGCAMFVPEDELATKLLQSVDISLDPSGRIEAVDGTAVFLNEDTGDMRSEASRYKTGEVVGDLPVRVTTRYRSDEGSGENLQDLAGYSGNVEIEISLENLTVESENLTFDVVGQSRTVPALVGVPLSVAASAALPDTSPSMIVFDTEAERRTDGVVSKDENDGSIVQWGALLAPPQTEATTTLRLVANVQDFSVPRIDLSVQAGLHTDLSFEGALASTIAAGPESPLGMQQQAISLVADVNDVLTRAGATITDVRKNLNDTSDTLGVRAAQRLNESSKQLAAQMEVLGTQMTSLQSGLSGTVNAASSAMNLELSQIVNTMSAMLGNTEGKPAKLYDGNGCTATLKERRPEGTVHSMFLYLSSLLDGYADASEGCQDLIIEKLNTAIGPEVPSVELCAAETSLSASCALYGGQDIVQESMQHLVDQGAQLAKNLQTDTAARAHTKLTGELAVDLTKLRSLIATLQSDTDKQEAWDQVEEQIQVAKDASNDLKNLRGDLRNASLLLSNIELDQSSIAVDVCALDDGTNIIDQEQLNALSVRITGEDCLGGQADPTTLPEQPAVTALQEVITSIELATEAMTTGWGSTSPAARLDQALSELEKETRELIRGGGKHSISAKTAKQLLDTLNPADAAVEELRGLLEQAMQEQSALGPSIVREFEEAAQGTEVQIKQELVDSITAVSQQKDQSIEEIGESYAELITSLRTSAIRTTANGKNLVEGQQASLKERYAETKQSMNERTTAALENIEHSTSAASKNVGAASAQLTDSLNKVILDLGDPKVKGSGILGAISASAAKSDTADFQLAEASQHAAGYANVRDQDITAILLRNAQFRASLDKTEALPPFHLEIPDGATSQTVYSFHLEGAAK